ncbi:MAG TPA: hypothetical protein VHL57_08715, partial [Flavobacteriales bacterium]|nr:hypothetical protein [Flavobacteriales bacterium]
TVSGAAPCPAATATVDVVVLTAPDPGVDGAVTLCASDAPIGLFALLGGSPDGGGAWTGPSVITNDAFDPAVMLAGAYTYRIDVPPPCVSVSSTVTVAIVRPPQAGADAPLTLCITSGPADLFTALGGTPDAGGTWTAPNNLAHNASFDPAVDATGIYRYTVSGAAPCPSATAAVNVVVLSNPDPGTDGLVTLCVNNAPISLFAQLGGTPDAGGLWTGPTTVTGDVFDPGAMSAGTYTYTIAVPPPCVSASSTVIVEVVQLPEPGDDAQLTRCTTASALDLFTQLGGTPQAGGSWTAPNGSPHADQFDPVVDAAGTYTYTVAGTSPCPSASAEIAIDLIAPPTAGADGSAVLCATGAPVPLGTLLSGADPGGSWSVPDGAVFNGTFVPGTDVPGNYTYTVEGIAPCPADFAVITLTVNTDPYAGEDGTLTLCAQPGPHDLFGVLGGSPDAGGTWTGPSGNLLNGQIDPTVDLPGIYRYVINVPQPCTSDSANVLLSVVQPPDAGEDGILALCAEGAAVVLFTALEGAPQSGGVWSAPGGVASSDLFDPQADAPGDYRYTVQGTAPCPNDQAIVHVDVAAPIVGTVTATDAICYGACDGTAVLQVAGGVAGYTYAWSEGVAGALDTAAVGLCMGTYAVAITDANGCTGAANFIVGQPPQLVIDAVSAVDETCIASCDGMATVSDPQGVRYSTDGGASWATQAVLTDLCAGVVTVTMQDVNGCEATAQVTVGSPPPVIADFRAEPDTVTIADPGVVFTNLSSNASAYAWDLGGLGTSAVVHPVFVFPSDMPGSYAVCLTATDANGCLDSLCRDVVVLDLVLVHIPNAFTPEGDGINEGFAPVFNLPEAVGEY